VAAPSQPRCSRNRTIITQERGSCTNEIWNAEIVSHTGATYVIEDAGYNGMIAPGQSASFGFNGSPGDVTAGPTNYVLNGVALG